MKPYKKLSTIKAKIETARQRKDIKITHSVYDNSVQVEQRLSANSSIWLQVDDIQYPKDMQRRFPPHAFWGRMYALANTIRGIAQICDHQQTITHTINAKTKTGPGRRAEARKIFEIKQGNLLLRHIPSQAEIARLRKQIADLQGQQKQLIPQMRAENAEYLTQKKWDAEIQRRRDKQALTSGQFWHASRDAIKSYFNPPFDKNYLADTSARWRAALFLGCESVSYKTYGGNWGHRLSGTGRAYLCGIDDNGDEWGHIVHIYLSHDQYDNLELEATVEDAMSELFDVSTLLLDRCKRQGDLLFCPETIPNNITLSPQSGPWEVRESHTIDSDGLERNGAYFKSKNNITVTHTSHPTVTMPAGGYRLYTLRQIDAD